MTIHVPIKEAKTRLSELLRSVRQGERVIVTRHGKPEAELVPAKGGGGIDFAALKQWKRDQGVDRVFTYVSPDFDDPLPDSFWFPED